MYGHILIYFIALNYFNKTTSSWGWQKFINKNDLFTKNIITNRPLVEYNRVVIGVYIRTYEYRRGLFYVIFESIFLFK